MAPKDDIDIRDREPKKILVLTSTFPRWQNDAEPPFVYELCRRLSRNYSVHILAPHAPGAAVEENFDGIHVTRYRYFFPRWQNLAYRGGILANLKQHPWCYALVPFFLAAQLYACVRLIRRRRFDCIHAHWLIPQGMIVILARLFIKMVPPVVVTSHGGDLYGLKGPVFERLKRFVTERSAAVTVVSQAMADSLADFIPNIGRIRVIPMGTDLRNRFVPPVNRRATGVVLFVGRLVEKKGLLYLVEAMPAILKRHPRAILRIVGAGQELDRIKSRIAALKISDRVDFRGAVKNNALPEIYHGADVVVFPSVVAGDGDREGFGLVLVEALGCECAAVVTDLPAMDDIVQHGRSALVVPEKNPAELAGKVSRLLADDVLRQKLGRQGRGDVLEKFDWETIAHRYTELFQLIIK